MAEIYALELSPNYSLELVINFWELSSFQLRPEKMWCDFIQKCNKNSITITIDFQSKNSVFQILITIMMTQNFTPFTYLFLSIYFIFIFILLSLKDFFRIWILIEVLILLFLGVSYTILSHRFSNLIQYFLIQTLASFSVLFFYLASFSVLYTISFFIKLAIFPFFSWFLRIIPRFPNRLFFLRRTFHKVPPFFLIYITSDLISLSIRFVSILLSIFVSCIIILYLSDLRLLLIISSVGNNSWFFLSFLQNWDFFSVFFIVYSFTLFFSLFFLKSYFSPSSSLILSVLALSGLPPFPLFFLKSYLILLSFNITFIFLPLLLLTALSLTAYVRSVFSYITFIFLPLPLYVL